MLFLVLLFSINSLKASKVFEVDISDSTQFHLTIGEPPQNLTAVINLLIGDLIVIDAKCGIRDKKCPLYCNNGKFMLILKYTFVFK